jgi:elongation factor Ts
MSEVKISAKMVKELRDRTGLGMMECKKALEEANGDVEVAIDNLRKSGQAKAAKKAGNIAADGAIIIAQGDNKAFLLEVNCQTDFVAKDENFTAFAEKVANLALENNVTDVAAISELSYSDDQTVEEARVSLVQKIGENIQIRRVEVLEGANIAAYRHGLRIGVVVSYEGGSEETGKNLAMHIAAFNPVAVDDESVDAVAPNATYNFAPWIFDGGEAATPSQFGFLMLYRNQGSGYEADIITAESKWHYTP